MAVSKPVLYEHGRCCHFTKLVLSIRVPTLFNSTRLNVPVYHDEHRKWYYKLLRPRKRHGLISTYSLLFYNGRRTDLD